MTINDSLKDNNSDRLIGLQIIRFLSALAILLWHYQHFSYVDYKPENYVEVKVPFYSFLSFFYDNGGRAVQIFWCLSGFIFFWKYRQSITSGLVSGREFFVLRFSRLYPLHLVTLILVACLQPIYFSLNHYYFVYPHNDIPNFILNFFMTSHWGFEKYINADGSDGFNAPIWSVSLEILAYIFFYLILRYVGKSALINIIVVDICVGLQAVAIDNQLFSCLIYFYLGGLAAIMNDRLRKHPWEKLITGIAWSLVLAVPLVVSLCTLYNPNGYVRYLSFSYDSPCFIAYVPLCLFCFAKEMPLTTITQNIISGAGNLTYASYLLHFPIQIMIAIYFSAINTPIPLYNTAFFVLFIAVTFLLSYFTYRYFEMPIQNTIRKKLI